MALMRAACALLKSLHRDQFTAALSLFMHAGAVSRLSMRSISYLSFHLISSGESTPCAAESKRAAVVGGGGGGGVLCVSRSAGTAWRPWALTGLTQCVQVAVLCDRWEILHDCAVVAWRTLSTITMAAPNRNRDVFQSHSSGNERWSKLGQSLHGWPRARRAGGGGLARLSIS